VGSSVWLPGCLQAIKCLALLLWQWQPAGCGGS